MAKLTWDDTGKKIFETGVDRGVVYPMSSTGTYDNGEAWNGLTAVNESPSGAEATKLWANNGQYGELRSEEEFGFTIEAYTYPDGFAACNGEKELVEGVSVAQQTRQKFGFSYRSLLGNDVQGTDYGYLLHLVYGATANPSEKSRATVNDSPEAQTMSWECSTTPVAVPDMKPTAHIIINSTKVDPDCLEALEKKLYGDESAGTATLPLPAEVKTLMTPSI